MKNNVIQGDCLEVMKSIPDESIDMILCDLPYGTVKCKWDNIIPFDLLWKEYDRIAKDTSPIVLTSAQPFTSSVVLSNPKIFKYEWIWEKEAGTGLLNAKKQPLRNHESICVFYKKQCLYNPQFTKGKPYTIKKGSDTSCYGNSGNITTVNNGFRYPKTIQRFNRDKGMHPTQKPVALFEYLIKTYTNEGDLVLDNCAGSGTTGVACQNAKRNYILIEKEPEYITIINKRLEDNQKRLNNKLFY